MLFEAFDLYPLVLEQSSLQGSEIRHPIVLDDLFLVTEESLAPGWLDVLTVCPSV